MKIGIKYDKKGFTLVETLFAVGILAVVITGLMQVFIHCSSLAEISGDLNNVIAQSHGKIDEMRNHTFADLTTDYAAGGSPGSTFTVSSPPGKGVITINSLNPELLQVDVVVSWQTKYGRIVGEDSDLDGTMDTGEDVNSDGELDSPVRLTALIAER